MCRGRLTNESMTCHAVNVDAYRTNRIVFTELVAMLTCKLSGLFDHVRGSDLTGT